MDPPLSPPPPGQQSDFTAPSSFVINFTASNTIFSILADLSVLLRLYTRAFLVRHVGPDDYLAITSLPFAIFSTVASQTMTKYGLGRHAWDVPVRNMVMFNKLYIASYAGYGVAILLIKLSLLLLYRRLFARISHSLFMVYWYIILAVVIIYGTASIMIGMFSCIPIKAAWDYSLPNRRCINGGAFHVSMGVLNATTDIAILALPLCLVSKLSLGKKQKIIVAALLCLGSFACLISLYRVSSSAGILRSHGYDYTYKLGVATFGGCNVEMCCGILCACLSTLRPLFQRFFGTMFTNSNLSPTGDYNWFPDGQFSNSFARRQAHHTDGRAFNAGSKNENNHAVGSEIQLNRIEAAGSKDRSDSLSSCGRGEADHKVRVTTTINIITERA